MPAEWEPHAATWLSWPHNRKTWPGKFEPIPRCLGRSGAHAGPVRAGEHSGRRRSGDGRKPGDWWAIVPNVTLHDIPTNDAWAAITGRRSSSARAGSAAGAGRLGVQRLGRQVSAVRCRQSRAASRSPRLQGRRRFTPGIVLEGGAIDGNGRGTLLTTEQCLLNPNRNPELSRADVERYLRDYLGVRHVLWLGEGIVGDDTDGHIDELARFVGPTTVVAALEADPHDENYRPAAEPTSSA